MSNTTLRKVQAEGLTDAQADRYALRCDLHPAMVWPGWDDWALTHLPVPDDDTYEDLGRRQLALFDTYASEAA